MMKATKMLTILVVALVLEVCGGQRAAAEPIIFDNGFPLFDTYGDVLHAHGGGILQYGGYFYYFGENRNYNGDDTFFAVSCYRSKDLKNWEFRNHVLTRDADVAGSIAAWGQNNYGQCDVPSPNDGFVAVAGGNYHGLGLKADGSIAAWGYNTYGQCDVPSPNTGFVSAGGGGYHSLGLKGDGSIAAWGRNNYGQCNVPSPNTGFVAVAGGAYHSLGLKGDGSIVAWGFNDYGQCDVASPNEGFVSVAGGSWHSLGLKADGSIAAWGNNTYGQCDVPSPNTGFVAVAAGGLHNLGLKADGSIVAWGYNMHGQCDVPSLNEGFIGVAGGEMHSLGLKGDSSIVAWGYNTYGQCNVPSPNEGFIAVAAGGDYSLGLKNPSPDLEYAKIERPKVIYCAATDKFVMWAHKEYGNNYDEARAAVAWCDTPDGDYTYVGSFRPMADGNEYISRDCTLFVDDDANGYFLSAANGNADLHLYKLTSDYLEVDYLVTKIWEGEYREAPCLFKRNGYYFIVSSGCTMWTPNQAKYGYATNLAGPWSSLYNVGNSTTYSSQSHYVLTLQGSLETSYLYMGDRWARAWSDYTDRSRYIWLPLEFTSDTNMVMNWYEAISIDTETGEIANSNESMVGWVKVDDDDPNVTYSAEWSTGEGNPGYRGTEHYCEVADSNATFSFTSTNARYYGFLRDDLGIAEISVDYIPQTTIDCYSKSASYDVLLYETDTLSYGPHTLTVRVTGDANEGSTHKIVCDAFAHYKLPDDFGSFDSFADYRFVNRHTGKALTVSGSPKTTPGAQIQQFLYAGDTSQQWQLNEPVPTYNTITSLASGQLMDIDGNSTSEGANIVQNPADGGSAQKWQLYNTGSGFYGMLNANSNLLAGIQNSSFADAAPAIQQADYDYISQQWLIFAEPGHIGHIWIEAETASGQPDFAPFAVNSGGALPEGQYIAVPDGSGDQSLPVTVGICQYDFDLDNYCVAEIFLLARAPDRYSNTCYISIDAAPYDTVTLQEHPSDFLWVKWSQFGLDPATHTLTIALQEDGTALDKILIRTRRILDFNKDGIVNFVDFADLASGWLGSDAEYDVVPYGGDGTVDSRELEALAADWLQ